jgi:hypothetical protein
MQIKTLREIILQEVLKLKRTEESVSEIVSGKKLGGGRTLDRVRVGDVFQILENCPIQGVMGSTSLSFKKYSNAYYLAIRINPTSVGAVPVSGPNREEAHALSFNQAEGVAGSASVLFRLPYRITLPEDLTPTDSNAPAYMRFTNTGKATIALKSRWDLEI